MTSVRVNPKRATPAVALDTKKLETRLAKAKTGLVLGHPFFGTLALNTPMTLSNKVPTAATNGKRVLFNPDFISELTDEELLFLVAHEVCHPMLEHNYRRNGRNHKKWNQAGDYVINQLLSDEKIGKMPSMGLLNPDIYAAGGGTLAKLGVTSTGTTAITDFSDLSFTTATITARGALIYNDTATGDPTVAVLDFGTDKTSTAGTFTIVFPAATATGAIIRIA